MTWTRRPWIWILGALNIGLLVALAVQTAGEVGGLSSAALAAGGLAYSLMATNLLLAVRLPVLERLLGPLDRLYTAHRVIGTSIVAVIGLHLVLIPIASIADRHQSLLASFGPAIPLGILGALIIIASVAIALNSKIPYHRWQPVHLAVAGGFLLLTAHFIVAGNKWITLASPAGALLALFMIMGLTSLGVRVFRRGRAGTAFRIAAITPLERGVEVAMEPVDRGLAPHQPGQFAFVTASPNQRRETHPFTLTNRAGSPRASVLIRPSGDWTELAQRALAVGDEVSLEGPFGRFTPPLGDGSPDSQVWVAAGAGITPFLSVLRSAQSTHADSPEATTDLAVELVCIARRAGDMPCWRELVEFERQLPWLSLRPWFTDATARPSPKTVRGLVDELPSDSVWYLCGPQPLSKMIEKTVRSTTRAVVNREVYRWRGAQAAARSTVRDGDEKDSPRTARRTA